MKNTPIQILDYIYYKDEASLKSNKFRIASNGSESMINENFSACFLSSDTTLLHTLNKKTYDTHKIIQRDMFARVIYLSNQKKVSILSCEEDEEKFITKILGKIYNLHRRLSSDNF